MNAPANTISRVLRMKLKAGDLAYKKGDFHAAMASYQSVQKQAERSDNQELLSISLMKTAICLSALDRLQEAETLLHKSESIEASRHILDLDEVIMLHHELSILLFRLNRMEEGYIEEKKALEILQRGDHIDDNLLVLVLKQLAVYTSQDEQFNLAISFLQDAMAVASASPKIGKDSLLYGQLLVTYALVLIDMRKFAEAQEYYDRGITLAQIALGEHNPKVADIYGLLSQHFKKAGQTEEATKFADLAYVVDNANRSSQHCW